MADIAEDIYQAYPRHVGKQAALKSIRKAMQDHDPEWLLARVRLFASSPKGQAGRYCPYPATWFNQGRFDDDDREWFIGGSRPVPPAKPTTPAGIAAAINAGTVQRINGRRVSVVSWRHDELVVLTEGERVVLDREDCRRARLDPAG